MIETQFKKHFLEVEEIQGQSQVQNRLISRINHIMIRSELNRFQKLRTRIAQAKVSISKMSSKEEWKSHLKEDIQFGMLRSTKT